MRFNSKDLALSAVFSSLYAVTVVFQGISAASIIQLRIADCLIPLAALFGHPAIIGVSLGCLFGNAYFSSSLQFGFLDILLGPVANFVAATLIFRFRRSVLLGCVAGSLAIGLIVGSYLWLLFPPPNTMFGVNLPVWWPPWVLSILSITTSSLVSLCFLGYILLQIMRRPGILEPLKARGLKVYL
ncbi:QueT transporter family protein [Candidatus Bathyarchaeota archaeon]|nr:MAG: QueT transporter family protein [Candidatus Bathyarchaeota archaeon]